MSSMLLVEIEKMPTIATISCAVIARASAGLAVPMILISSSSALRIYFINAGRGHSLSYTPFNPIAGISQIFSRFRMYRSLVAIGGYALSNTQFL